MTCKGAILLSNIISLRSSCKNLLNVPLRTSVSRLCGVSCLSVQMCAKCSRMLWCVSANLCPCPIQLALLRLELKQREGIRQLLALFSQTLVLTFSLIFRCAYTRGLHEVDFVTKQTTRYLVVSNTRGIVTADKSL